MKTYKCEEMICDGCVNRIKKGLDGVDIRNTADLFTRTVVVDEDVDYGTRAVKILDDLGFTAVGVQYKACNRGSSKVIITVLKALIIHG